MTETRDTTADLPAYKDIPTAPFVYFDVVGALGVLNGAIQLELASRTLIPTPDGGAIAEMLCSGRIRCSPNAAMALREAIDKALQMLQQPMPQQAAATGKLN